MCYHVTLPKPLGDRFYYHIHFKDEETEEQLLLVSGGAEI